MEQCCSFLASLQADVPDSSTVSFTQEEPQELLAQAEMHQDGLEQEQQALASLEHRLEHALSLSSSQDPISPGPVGKTLVKIQENVRRWDLFNIHMESEYSLMSEMLRRCCSPQLEREEPAGGSCSPGRGERETASPRGDRRGGTTRVRHSSLAGGLFESKATTGHAPFYAL